MASRVPAARSLCWQISRLLHDGRLPGWKAGRELRMHPRRSCCRTMTLLCKLVVLDWQTGSLGGTQRL